MGSFFKEKKTEFPVPSTQERTQGWFAVLISGAISLISAIIVLFVYRPLAFVARPTFQHLFTFVGRTREQILLQIGIVIAIFGVPLYFAYRIPAVRDAVSLSETSTLNLSENKLRIIFPDRSFFTASRHRQGMLFNSRTYFSYAGHSEKEPQRMWRNECQGVTRGEKIYLSSKLPPRNAEGFSEEVRYVARQRIGSLGETEYLFEWIKRPSLWRDKNELEQIVVDIRRSSSWERFIDNWIELRMDEDGYRTFEVKALAREHAVVCF